MRMIHLEDSINDASLVADLVRAEWPEARITRVAQLSEFVAALEEDDFDLILSDYSLPGFDGLAALEIAHSRCPEKPFVFLSGTIGEDRAIEALHRGAADYLIKDRPARLASAIRQACTRAEEKARHRKAEQALRESEQRFLQLAEQSSEIFWFFDLEPARVLYISPAAVRIFGVPVSHFYREPWFGFSAMHPHDRPRVEAAFAAWVAGGRTRFEEEYRVVRPDGSFSWLLDTGTLIRNAEGKVYRLSGIAKDVTSRHLAEEQLRDQAALLDKARDAIIANGLDHRIAYWNASAERLYGWSAADVFGRDIRELELGYCPARFAAARDQVLACGEWRGAFALRSKQGLMLQIETTWSLVLDNAGQPGSILMIDADVTEKKKLETRALQADRIDSIGMLAGGIAHDLNNVLAPILMGAELLRMGVLEPKALKTVGSIERSAKHGAALVRQILNFARGGSREVTEVRIGPLIEEVRELLSQSLSRTIEIAIDHTGSIHPVFADGTQIKQLLINLALNARDAMPNGGRIDIQATDITVDAALAKLNPGAQTGPHLRISVRDTGTGIPQELLARIFDPFFTTKSQAKGTGLGLSTVLGIVRSHGGFVTVKSEFGRGTEFQLFLPALLETPQPAALSDNPFATTGHGELVLAVDDDPSIRETLRLVLEASGYRVLSADSAPAGLAEFDRQSDMVMGVITDIHLPGMTGIELISEMRRRKPLLGILVVSGAGEPKDLETLKNMSPPVEFLAKPVSSADLLLSLKWALAGSRKSPSPPRTSG